MYPSGGLVVLAIDKAHGEGEDAIKIKSGICGIVTHCKKEKTGNHQYTVDFGAYGGWYCRHSELSGDDKEGWDGDQVEEREETVDELEDTLGIVLEPLIVADLNDTLEDEDSENYQEEEATRSLTKEQRQEAGFVTIDLEADMKRRMDAIERGEE
jgi:hypothetical protein